MQEHENADSEALRSGMRAIDSMADTRLTGVPALVNKLLIGVPAAAAVAMFVWVRYTGPAWMLAPAIALIALAVWLGGRHFKHAWMAQNRRDTAAADALLASGASIVLRRRLRFGWPLATTVMAAVFSVVALSTDFRAISVIVAAVLLFAAITAWILATRRARPFGAVTPDGLRMGEETFPWHRVDVSARSTGGFGRTRALSVMLTGDAREFGIPLGELDGTAAVIHQVIDGYVQRDRDAHARAAAARQMQTVVERLRAHPEEADAMARDFREQLERDIEEHHARMRRFDAELASLSRRSPWSGRPGALPVKQQWLFVGGVFAALAIAGFGLNTDLYKSAQWSRLSDWIALGATLAVSGAALAKLLPRVPGRSRLAVSLIAPLAIGGFAWLLLANALPDAYTRLAGKRFATEQDMRAQAENVRTCRLRVYAAMFVEGNPSSHYCASSAEFARLPSAGVMRARGRETWFGKHVDVVEPVDPTFHPAR